MAIELIVQHVAAALIFGALMVAIFRGKRALFKQKPPTGKEQIVVAAIWIFVSVLGQLGTSLSPFERERSVAEGLKKAPLGNALATNAPQEFENLVKRIAAVDDRAPDAKEQITNLVLTTVDSIVNQRVTTAPDAVVVRWATAQALGTREIQQRDPIACYNKIYGHTAQNFVPSEATYNALTNARIELLQTSAQTPQASQAFLRDKLRPIMTRLGQRYGSRIRVLDNPTAPDANKQDACEITLTLWEEIAHRPPEEAGPILRALYKS